MKRTLVIAALTVAGSPLALSQGKPNFSGVWKLQSTQVTEVLKIEHQEPKIHMVYDIEDEVVDARVWAVSIFVMQTSMAGYWELPWRDTFWQMR